MEEVDSIEVVKTFVLANMLKGQYSHINNFPDYKRIYGEQKKEVDTYYQIKGSKWSAKKIYTSSGEIACGELNHLFRILPLSFFLNKHVPIIVVDGGLIRKRNPKLEKEKYDIEDGSNRSICLGLLGRTHVNAFIGVSKS